MLLTLYRIRYSNHRQIRRKSLAGQQDCIHQRHHPAPNFGKTAGIPKNQGLTGGYGEVKGFSEIGRQERTRQLERGSLILGVTLLAWSGLSTPIYCRPAYFLQMDGG